MGERDEADKRTLAASERKRRERAGDEALTGGARVSAGGSRARVGPPGPGREGGNEGARGLGWKSAQPMEGEEFFFFFFFF